MTTIATQSYADRVEVTIGVSEVSPTGKYFGEQDASGQLEVSTDGTNFTNLGSPHFLFNYSSQYTEVYGNFTVNHTSATIGTTYYYRYRVDATLTNQLPDGGSLQ